MGVYGGPEKVHINVRSRDGTWGDEAVLDAGVPPEHRVSASVPESRTVN